MGNQQMCCGQHYQSQQDPAPPIEATAVSHDSIVNQISNTDFKQKVFNKIKNSGNQSLLNCQLSKVIENQQQTYYQGQFKQSLQGKGFMYTTKAFYAGDLKKGQPHGRGIVMFLNGGEFQGEFQNGQAENGTYRNGDYHFKGEIKNSIKNGKGEEIQKLSYFKGKFLNGLRQQGIFFPNKDNPQVYYQGTFENDKPTWGKYRIPGATISQFTLDQQTLQLVHGKIVFDNGDLYQGEIKDGKMQGAGMYTARVNGQLQAE